MELVESLSPAPDEVGAIWSVPLEYCLTAQWKEEYGVPSEKGGPDWPYEDDYYVGFSIFFRVRSGSDANSCRIFQIPIG